MVKHLVNSSPVAAHSDGHQWQSPPTTPSNKSTGSSKKAVKGTSSSSGARTPKGSLSSGPKRKTGVASPSTPRRKEQQGTQQRDERGTPKRAADSPRDPPTQTEERILVEDKPKPAAPSTPQRRASAKKKKIDLYKGVKDSRKKQHIKDNSHTNNNVKSLSVKGTPKLESTTAKVLLDEGNMPLSPGAGFQETKTESPQKLRPQTDKFFYSDTPTVQVAKTQNVAKLVPATRAAIDTSASSRMPQRRDQRSQNKPDHKPQYSYPLKSHTAPKSPRKRLSDTAAKKVRTTNNIQRASSKIHERPGRVDKSVPSRPIRSPKSVSANAYNTAPVSTEKHKPAQVQPPTLWEKIQEQSHATTSTKVSTTGNPQPRATSPLKRVATGPRPNISKRDTIHQQPAPRKSPRKSRVIPPHLEAHFERGGLHQRYTRTLSPPHQRGSPKKATVQSVITESSGHRPRLLDNEAEQTGISLQKPIKDKISLEKDGNKANPKLDNGSNRNIENGSSVFNFGSGSIDESEQQRSNNMSAASTEGTSLFSFLSNNHDEKSPNETQPGAQRNTLKSQAPNGLQNPLEAQLAKVKASATVLNSLTPAKEEFEEPSVSTMDTEGKKKRKAQLLRSIFSRKGKSKNDSQKSLSKRMPPLKEEASHLSEPSSTNDTKGVQNQDEVLGFDARQLAIMKVLLDSEQSKNGASLEPSTSSVPCDLKAPTSNQKERVELTKLERDLGLRLDLVEIESESIIEETSSNETSPSTSPKDGPLTVGDFLGFGEMFRFWGPMKPLSLDSQTKNLRVSKQETHVHKGSHDKNGSFKEAQSTEPEEKLFSSSLSKQPPRDSGEASKDPQKHPIVTSRPPPRDNSQIQTSKKLFGLSKNLLPKFRGKGSNQLSSSSSSNANTGLDQIGSQTRPVKDATKTDLSAQTTVFNVRLSLGYLTGLTTASKTTKLSKAQCIKRPVAIYAHLAYSSGLVLQSSNLAEGAAIIQNDSQGKVHLPPAVWGNKKDNTKGKVYFSVALPHSSSSESKFSPVTVCLVVGVKRAGETIPLGSVPITIEGMELKQKQLKLRVIPDSEPDDTKKGLFSHRRKTPNVKSFQGDNRTYSLENSSTLTMQVDINAGDKRGDIACGDKTSDDESFIHSLYNASICSVSYHDPLEAVEVVPTIGGAKIIPNNSEPEDTESLKNNKQNAQGSFSSTDGHPVVESRSVDPVSPLHHVSDTLSKVGNRSFKSVPGEFIKNVLPPIKKRGSRKVEERVVDRTPENNEVSGVPNVPNVPQAFTFSSTPSSVDDYTSRASHTNNTYADTRATPQMGPTDHAAEWLYWRAKAAGILPTSFETDAKSADSHSSCDTTTYNEASTCHSETSDLSESVAGSRRPPRHEAQVIPNTSNLDRLKKILKIANQLKIPPEELLKRLAAEEKVENM